MSEVVIAHEHYPARGGGEIVADELAECFNAPIVTGWIKDKSYSRFDVIEILENTPVSFLRSHMGNPLIRDVFYAFAWESVPTLREYDVIIQSGNACSWYVPEQEQTIIKYNHSPPRNPYDLFWRDESHTAGPLDLFIPGYVVDRLWKKLARQTWANRKHGIDLWVCNSELIKHRTKKYLSIPDERLEVVYPPVDVDQYDPTDEHDGYYIALSRLEPSKHIDQIIHAFERVDAPLKVVGDGNQRDELEQLAQDMDNVTMEGYVSDERKRELLQNAKASIFAAENEDFGMVPIESMAAGTPVIGIDDGFTKYQIKHGQNGLLFDGRRPSWLAGVIRDFERSGVSWDARQLHEFAQQFGVDRFHREMTQIVEQAQEMDTIEPDLKEPTGTVQHD